MLRDTPTTIYLKDYQPPEYLIDRVDLTFDLGEEETRVRSVLHLRENPAAEASGVLRLQGEQLELIALSLDGRSLQSTEYLLDEEGLTLHQMPAQCVLESEVRILPQKNTALEGLYKSGAMFCTQCEAEGFRKITWFLDRPDVMSRFTTTIRADRSRYPVLLSNGNSVDEAQLDDGMHQITWEDPFPKPAYLFALVAGDLRSIEASHTTPSGRDVALKIYVEPENIEKCDHAMASLKHAMTWDEQHYGREYDLDIYMIVAVNDFNMGAMENKGLNIFNSKYVLASSDTATDRDFEGIESVIAHEYFHNWTGNRITCRDWFQLSLKEGLTVFRDQEFSADMGSRGVKRIEDVRLLRAHQFAEDASPMAHPVRPDSYMEINNFYTVTVYEKGAEVVRMQSNLLGADLYRKGTDLYFERFDGQAVTTDDFVQCMADASGRDFSQFKRWYSQAGTPELTISSDFQPEQQSYTLTVEQHCPATPGQSDKATFLIPLAVGLRDKRGNDMPLQLQGETGVVTGTRMLELSERRQQFKFIGITERPVPALLRGFSAPVKLQYDYSDEELMFHMASEPDGFCRWDAAQTLALRILLKIVATPDAEIPAGFVEAFRKALTDRESDQALLAEVLTLPSESYMGDQMQEVDVEGIHRSRESLKRHLAHALKDELLSLYHDNYSADVYVPDAASIGRRSLRNLALSYLMQLDDASILKLCIDQFKAGQNMTDVLAALSLVADKDVPEAEQLLEQFYQQWQTDPLVMDKWFTLQALANRSDTLDRVKMLMKHPAFSIANPNKVRSLIGAFCSGNAVGFHAADGSGYQFLGDRVLELDGLNPQVASRMVRIMARWQRYDAQRQQVMKAQLERILKTEGISRDVFEIASKSLEQ